MIFIKRNIFIKNLAAGAMLVLFQCCAPLIVKPTIPLGDEEIARYISAIRKQGRMVQTLFSSGRVILKRPDSEVRANILIVATKYPTNIKIEITHPWGRPLFHLLINETTIKALSFPDKRLYTGPVGSSGVVTFFPIRFGPDQIWNLVRGYPTLQLHDKAVSQRQNRISLIDREGKTVQVIDFDPEKRLPYSTSFPIQDITITFSRLQNENKIYYARKIVMADHKNKTSLTLNLRQMVFNTAIPKSVFELKVPAGFETLPFESTVSSAVIHN